MPKQEKELGKEKSLELRKEGTGGMPEFIENLPEDGFVFLSDGTANLENWTLTELPIGPFGRNHNKFNHAAWGDINNDGNNDIVVAVTRDLPYYEGAYIQVLLGDGHDFVLAVHRSHYH